MHRLLSIVVILWMVSGALAEEIKVPLRYQRKSTGANISEVGVYRDAQKFIIAARIAGLPEFFQDRGGVSLYLNNDDDVNTGRFSGVSGFDLQFNINLPRRRAHALIWPQKTELAFYDDDYLVSFSGDMFFFAVRADALKRFKFADAFSVRILCTRPGVRRELTCRIDMKKDFGTMTPALDFVRFGSEQSTRTRYDDAVEISRSDGLRVWNSFGERYAENESVPPLKERVSALRFQAARGERESVVFAVSGSRPFGSFKVTPGVLRQKPGGATLPVAALEIGYVGFVRNERGESFTDIITPEFRPNVKSVNHFAVVTVDVPRRTPPGIYSGQLALTVDGATVEPVPLELEVYDFDLPEFPTFKTAYSIKRGHIGRAFSKAQAAKIYPALLQMAAKHRFSPRLIGAVPGIRVDSGGKLQVDWKKFDAAAKQYFDVDKFTIYQPTLPQLGSHDKFYRWPDLLKRSFSATSPEFLTLWREYLKQFKRYHDAHGLLPKTLFVIWDEPYTVWPDINAAARVVREELPDLPVGILIQAYEPAIAENIDLWLMPLDSVGAMRANSKLKKLSAWAYNLRMMGNFRVPAADIRALYGLAWNEKIDGFLSSEINHFQNIEERNGNFFNNYPVHCWVYADRHGRVYSSLRLLLTRDGIDDYDYLALLKSRLKGKTFPTEISGALPRFVSGGEVEFKLDSNRRLQAWRDRLARAVVDSGR